MLIARGKSSPSSSEKPIHLCPCSKPSKHRKFGSMTTIAATDFLPVIAAAGVEQEALIVSIHDVAPSTRSTVEKILSEVARKGVRFCSILVVPDYHHQGLFAQDRQFVSWLRNLEADGHEMVIHGYFHERPARANETLRDKFITRFYTCSEGEFYDLDYDEALRRITKARDQFREAGLTPRGFIAPAWLLSKDGERAARDAELEYTTRLRTVRDLRTQTNFAARSVVYSVENSWRRGVSLACNGALFQLMKKSPLFRVSIHPADFLYPRIGGQILDSLDRMRGRRTSTTYRDWIAEQRVRTTPHKR
jgi:predicted deacetylase